MLKFYQQARVLKTQRYTVHESSSIQSMAESLTKQAVLLKSRRGKTMKRERVRPSIAPYVRQGLEINSEQKDEEVELKFNLFKNLGIKQKLKDIQLWKGEQKIRKRLVKETVELKKYETSVHQYLVKKIKQKMERSEEEKIRMNQSAFDYQKPNKKNLIRYKTLNDENAERQCQEYINIITQNLNSKANKKISLKKEIRNSARQSSNLISHDESLLAHIVKRQKEFQQKSLKIVVLNNRHSIYNKKSCGQNPMAMTAQKWKISKRRSESRTNHLKVQSICNYKASEYVVAMKKEKKKKSTQNLIRPWDSESKEEQ